MVGVGGRAGVLATAPEPPVELVVEPLAGGAAPPRGSPARPGKLF